MWECSHTLARILPLSATGTHTGKNRVHASEDLRIREKRRERGERQGVSSSFVHICSVQIKQQNLSEFLHPPFMNHLRKNRNPSSINLPLTHTYCHFLPIGSQSAPSWHYYTQFSTVQVRFWSFLANRFTTIRQQTYQYIWLLRLLWKKMLAYYDADSSLIQFLGKMVNFNKMKTFQ